MRKIITLVLILLLLLFGCSEKTVPPQTGSPSNPVPSSVSPKIPAPSSTAPAQPLPSVAVSVNQPALSPSPSLSTAAPAVSAAPPSPELRQKWRYDIKSDGLYRTELSTGSSVRLCPIEDASETILTADWVYFIAENRLYRMDNANKRELLVEEDCSQPRLNNGSIYYCTGDGIMRMGLDGSEKQLIRPCNCTGLVVTDKYIFYALEVPESVELDRHSDDGPRFMGELHRVGLNGEGDVKIVDIITGLSVYKNTVYYADRADAGVYSIKPESLEKSLIYKGIGSAALTLEGGYAFFNADHKLYRVWLADGAAALMKQTNHYRLIGLIDGYYYFELTGDSPGVYRLKDDGAELESVG